MLNSRFFHAGCLMVASQRLAGMNDSGSGNLRMDRLNCGRLNPMRIFHRGSFHRIFQCSWTQSEGLRKLALDCWRAWTVLPASTLLIYLALPIGIPRHLFLMLDNLLKYFPHHYFPHFIPVEQNYVANMATTCEFIMRFQSFHGYKSEYPNFWTPNGGKSPTVSLTLWLFNVANSKPSPFLKNRVHHHKINGPSSIAMWKSHHSET